MSHADQGDMMQEIDSRKADKNYLDETEILTYFI